jgi:chromosome segregation ATPase
MVSRAKVDKSEVDLLALMAAIKDMRAEVKAIQAMIRERQAALAELNVALESALGKLEKERCSRSSAERMNQNLSGPLWNRESFTAPACLL